jgi:hypothetical protein
MSKSDTKVPRFQIGDRVVWASDIPHKSFSGRIEKGDVGIVWGIVEDFAIPQIRVSFEDGRRFLGIPDYNWEHEHIYFSPLYKALL